MSDAWLDNPQANVRTAADDEFGLSRRSEPDGGRTLLLAPGPHTHGANGLPPVGLLFLLADSTLGSAGVRVVGNDEVIVTSNMHLDLHARPFERHALLEGHGQPASRYHGGTAGMATFTEDGLVVASATGRFVVLHVDSRTGGTIGAPDRTATPLVVPPRSSADPLVAAPIFETIRFGIERLTADTLVATVVARPEFANERLGLHGGIGALMGEQACDALIRSVASQEADFRATEVRATFLRPLPADGSLVRCTASIQHLGRRIIAARAVLDAPGGKPAVIVDVLAAGVVDKS